MYENTLLKRSNLVHVDHVLDPPSPLWTDMDNLETPLPPYVSTWFMNAAKSISRPIHLGNTQLLPTMELGNTWPLKKGLRVVKGSEINRSNIFLPCPNASWKRKKQNRIEKAR